MGKRAVITVFRPPEEVQRLWESSSHRLDGLEESGANVSFVAAPGERGTEIHVDLGRASRAPKLVGAVRTLTGSDPRAKAMDELRRFKQRVETGVIARSEGAPEGELAERKLKQRPAQPLDDAEVAKAGV